MFYRDRSDAGRQLAGRLASYADRPDVLVLALPRGGLPVASEVARALHAPLDVFVVRKLGVPGQPELAMGAIASGGVRVLNEEVVQGLGIPDWMIDDVAREAGLSRPHFYKLFRRQTGITPNLYLNTLRMERAIESLTETGRTVTEIGYDLGFSSQSGFTRFFASNVGMAPSDYRRVAHRLHARSAGRCPI